MAQVTDIRTLQEIDDEGSTARVALEDAERRLLGSEDLAEARRVFGATETELADTRRTQRRIEGEVEGFTARITPEEKRLYDGSVRNPKELTNIQHEVDNLKVQRGKLEDELLEVLATLERVEGEHAAAKKVLAREEARWARDEAALTAEASRLKELIARTDARREAQKLKIEARNLIVYEDVRRRRGGIAVARVTGGNCGGCRVGIPEAVRKRAFGNDMLAQCPNCERILYVG